MKYIDIRLMYPSTAEAEIDEYVRSALEHWGGQFHPDDHLFPSDDLQVVSLSHLGPIAISRKEEDRIIADYKEHDGGFPARWAMSINDIAEKYNRNYRSIVRVLRRRNQPFRRKDKR